VRVVRVVLDNEKCQGHGRCYVLAPEVFGPDEEGYGTVLLPEVSGASLEQAQLGVLGCPEAAIHFEEQAGP
jgi:ferredoxin